MAQVSKTLTSQANIKNQQIKAEKPDESKASDEFVANGVNWTGNFWNTSVSIGEAYPYGQVPLVHKNMCIPTAKYLLPNTNNVCNIPGY
jgi:hypothetical protein